MGERPDIERGPRPSIEDFEKLLELAEDLQKERDREREALERYTRQTLLVTIATALMAAGLAYAFVLRAAVPSWLQIAFAALFLIVLAAVLATLTGQTSRRFSIRRDLEASEHALYETVGLLRETEHAFSDDWPVLQKARFRIRLSRFAIGPDDAWYGPQIKRKA